MHSTRPGLNVFDGLVVLACYTFVMHSELELRHWRWQTALLLHACARVTCRLSYLSSEIDGFLRAFDVAVALMQRPSAGVAAAAAGAADGGQRRGRARVAGLHAARAAGLRRRCAGAPAARCDISSSPRVYLSTLRALRLPPCVVFDPTAICRQKRRLGSAFRQVTLVARGICRMRDCAGGWLKVSKQVRSNPLPLACADSADTGDTKAFSLGGRCLTEAEMLAQVCTAQLKLLGQGPGARRPTMHPQRQTPGAQTAQGLSQTRPRPHPAAAARHLRGGCSVGHPHGCDGAGNVRAAAAALPGGIGERARAVARARATASGTPSTRRCCLPEKYA